LKPVFAVMQLNIDRECSASADEVWRLVSQVENLPKYWHGTRELKVVKKGSEYNGEVKFAFGGRGRIKVKLDESKRKVIIEYLDGAFTGSQIISVNKGGLSATWDIHFRGIFKVFGKVNADHFASGTSNALARICEEAMKPENP
jgi:uncharacterized protein YndB with AHSA1/START domain